LILVSTTGPTTPPPDVGETGVTGVIGVIGLKGFWQVLTGPKLIRQTTSVQVSRKINGQFGGRFTAAQVVPFEVLWRRKRRPSVHLRT
jgi:hypothetical protein